MKKKIIAFCAVACTLFAGCHIFQAINLVNCQYDYSKVDQIRFMEMSPRELLTISGGATAAVGLMGKAETVPLDMTIHVRVINPDAKKTAAFESVAYTVALDTIYLGAGQAIEPLTVGPKDTVDMPLRFSVDLKQALKSEKRPVVSKAVKTLVGLSNEPTKVNVQLKPTIKMGKNGTYTYPNNIPVSFYIGKTE